MARDRFDREIDYLRISVTDKCDLKCTYCKPGLNPSRFKPEEILTRDELRRITAAAIKLGVRKVRLTGGEPLLRPDILDIIADIKAEGVRDLSLTTNGLRMPKMAAALKSAGLDRVNISLDSMKPDRYKSITGCGELKDVLSGIDAAESAGLLPVKINMVPMRNINDDEIVDFARLTMDKPYHVRFIEYMPAGKRGAWDSIKCVRAEEAKAVIAESLGELHAIEFKGKGPSRNYKLCGAQGVIGFISAVSHEFCYSCNRLRLNAVGRIRPCLFSNTEIDIAGPLRKGATDEELVRLFLLALDVKPAGNYLKDPGSATAGAMSSIGG